MSSDISAIEISPKGWRGRIGSSSGSDRRGAGVRVIAFVWHCNHPGRAPSLVKAIVPVTGWARLVAVERDHAGNLVGVIAFTR
jgi:hypothetical protein